MQKRAARTSALNTHNVSRNDQVETIKQISPDKTMITASASPEKKAVHHIAEETPASCQLFEASPIKEDSSNAFD